MKIIHLSDTHVGHGKNEQRLERIVEDILSLGSPHEYVVVPGDLIDKGTVSLMAVALPALEWLRR
jgi:3',5'-cyclic AMP phosphodiesterase CpdA